MKKKTMLLLALTAVLMGTSASRAAAQAVSIGETEFTPNAGAILDVRSANKGVLIPRMSYTQRMYIPTNAESAGLLVYQTDREAGFYYFDGLVWKFLNPNASAAGELPNLARVASTGSYEDLQNKPELKAVATTGSYEDLTNKPAIPARLQDLQQDENYYTTVSRAERERWNAAAQTGSFGGNYNELTNKPELKTVATTGSYEDLTSKPSFARVASTGSYEDLSDKPAIPARLQDLQQDENYYTTVSRTERERWNAAAQASTFSGSYTDLSNKPELKPVATTGDYADLQNKPAIPTRLQDLEQDPNYYTTVSRAEREKWDAAAEASTFSGSYNDLKNKPFIPENLSDLADDATHQLVTATQKTRWDAAAAGATFTGSWNDLTDKPNVPRYLSDLEENDYARKVTADQISLWTAAANNGGGGGNGFSGSYEDLTNKPTIPTRLQDLEQDPNYYTTVSRAEREKWDAASDAAVSSVDRERWNNKAESTPASTSSNGLMTAEMASRLAAIEDKANNYVHPETHPAMMIEEDAYGQRKFVSSAQMERWENTSSSLNDLNQRLHKVASTGAYGDLEDKPNLEQLAANVAADAATALYNHAIQPHFSGKFADLTNPIYADTRHDGLIKAAEYNKLQIAYDYASNPPTSSSEKGGLMSAKDKDKLDKLHEVATTGSYGDLKNIPAILEDLADEPTRLPQRSDITSWNAAYAHSSTAHFSGSYADLQNKPVLLREEHVSEIAKGNYNQNVNGVYINDDTEVTVTAKTIKTIFDHATQAAHDALPVGTVIMWSGALGGDINDYIGTGKSWKVFTEMQGRFPVAAAYGVGTNNGLQKYSTNETGGTEQVTLQASQMPKHRHTARYGRAAHNDGGSDYKTITGFTSGTVEKVGSAPKDDSYDGGETNDSGGDSSGNTVAHENRPPYYALVFLIKVK